MNVSGIFVSIFCALTCVSMGAKIKDYCNPHLCFDAVNTACNNTGRFSSICPHGIQLFRFSLAQKEHILFEINNCRSNVTLGSANNYKGELFPYASEMSKVQWDVEQEFMASLQIKTCISNHDPCKNTWFDSSNNNDVVFSGQNIYYESSFSPVRGPMSQTITNAISAWYNEIVIAPIDEVESVHEVQGYVVGHFLMMIHDKAERVGCSASQWDEPPNDKGLVNKLTVFTCNFYKSPIISQPLYSTGDPCSGCEDTCDWESETPGLCVVDPENFAHTYMF